VFIVFFTDVDRTPFLSSYFFFGSSRFGYYLLGYYFFGYYLLTYYFLIFAPELALFGKFVGILFCGVITAF